MLCRATINFGTIKVGEVIELPNTLDTIDLIRSGVVVLLTAEDGDDPDALLR